MAMLQTLSSQQSDSKTRSFSDVLNAMRDTEVIEKEKRQLGNGVNQARKPQKQLIVQSPGQTSHEDDNPVASELNKKNEEEKTNEI